METTEINKERNIGMKASSHKHTKVSTELTSKDIWKHFKIRMNIGRHSSTVDVGIYSIGNPDSSSPLFISSNFLMSFDKLRNSLKEMNVWILVIDTKGINVWCAAGKGTFGTTEIISKIKDFNVENLINHKNIIVPQLGASGTQAHVIKKESGFNVVYGPVYASEIKNFLKNGSKADQKMRTISFNLTERIVLIPVELVGVIKYFILGSIYLYLIAYFSKSGFEWRLIFEVGNPLVGAFAMSILAGSVITPIFLPLIPFRSFVLKGALVGFVVQEIYALYLRNHFSNYQIIGSLLLFTAVSAFLAFNFTGCTTFTSKSGVKKEMSLFIRPLILFAFIGLILLTLATLGVL